MIYEYDYRSQLAEFKMNHFIPMVLIVYFPTGERKFILRVWSSMPKQREVNNHTSQINILPVS